MTDLTQIITTFIEELLATKSNFIPRNPDILLLASLLPQYHIDGVTIWRKKEWVTQYEVIMAKRKRDAEQSKLLDLKREVMLKLMTNIRSYLGGDDEDQIRDIALTIIKSRAVEGAKMFGVDIENLPDLEMPVTLIERNKEIYTIQ